MTDTSHLVALTTRLAHERARRDAAPEGSPERAMRDVWVAGCEREIAAEEKFLGITPAEPVSDEDLDAFLDSLDPEDLA